MCIFCVLGSAPLPLLAVSLSQPPADLLSPEQHTAHCNKRKKHLNAERQKYTTIASSIWEDDDEVTTNMDKKSQDVRKINLHLTQS